jgi:uncharacterized protein YndB with AHSA1/START domain
MSIDISRIIGAVTRSVLHGERDGRPTHIVVATRSYPTDVEDAWDAITSRERIPRWFLPITGELRLGGRYQLEGNAGGEILRCDRPSHLAVTWVFNGETSWVDVRLTAEGAARTRLELRHEAHVPVEFWDQFGPGAVGVGWDLALLGLELYLQGAPMDPAAAQAFHGTPEGRQLVAQASADWCRASIAAGTAREAAEAAAARTTAFYTGASGEDAAHAP